MTIVGRYKNSNDLRNITLKLTGKAGKETKTFSYTNLDFPNRADENNFLPRLWASRRVGWLLEQIRAIGETKETKDEVVDLGTRDGLVTPYTSYLATDGSLSNIRAGMTMDSARAMPAAKAMQDRSGARAVQLSVQQNNMQSNMSVVADEKKEASEQILIRNTVTNQFVANKNFTSQDSVWIDADYSESARLPEISVKFASDEYFRLVSVETGLAPYLSLGDRVIVVWKGKVYRVTK